MVTSKDKMITSQGSPHPRSGQEPDTTSPKNGTTNQAVTLPKPSSSKNREIIHILQGKRPDTNASERCSAVQTPLAATWALLSLELPAIEPRIDDSEVLCVSKVDERPEREAARHLKFLVLVLRILVPER
eukprot:691624-Rhodomonas_salina.3